MTKLGRLWAGAVYGTNTGKLAAELNYSDEAKIIGVLRFMDDRFGLVVYETTGKFNGTQLELAGTVKQSEPGVQAGNITVTATLNPKGELRGEWKSEIGTGGTFILFPHDSPNTMATAPPGFPLERIHTARRKVGALTLDADDVLELIGFIARDFNTSPDRVIVTYQERGSEISRYASDFKLDCSKLGEKKYLKLFIQEPDAYGLNRAAVIELTDVGNNEVQVEGVQESWVLGKAEALTSKLKQHEHLFTTTVRKIGLNITTLLVVGAAIMLPELTLGRRLIFAAFIWILVWAVIRLNAKLVPNVSLYFSERKSSILQKIWPQAISFVIALASALTAAIAYGLISGELSSSRFW